MTNISQFSDEIYAMVIGRDIHHVWLREGSLWHNVYSSHFDCSRCSIPWEYRK